MFVTSEVSITSAVVTSNDVFSEKGTGHCTFVSN